jgi:hypothetical protein
MLCLLCGRICDYHPSGFCQDCTELLTRNNQKVALLALLAEAAIHCPVHLQERIEKVLGLVKVPFEVKV